MSVETDVERARFRGNAAIEPSGSGSDAEGRPQLLLLAPYFPPAFYGGAVQVYLGLLRHLRGFDVAVLADLCQTTARDAAGWDAGASQELGVSILRMPAFELHLPSNAAGGKMRMLAQLVAFFLTGRRAWKRALRSYKPDIVVSGQTYSAGWLTAGLWKGVPLVNYVHGEELTMQMRSRWLSGVMRRWQLRSIRRAALNIAVSDYTARLTAEVADADPAKIAVLSNFVDTARFHLPVDRDALRAGRGWSDHLIVLTLARLEQRKGIDQALRAIALLQQTGRLRGSWRYVIAGRGEEAAALRTLAHDLGLGEQVIFAGFVPDSDVVAMYQAADVFLQPNREINGDTEGFGIVFLEANACGLPVIGGIAGGTGGAIEDGVSGYRVDGDSVEAIAGALDRLANDAELRRRLGAQGAARVVENFTVEAAAARFGDMLRDVLAHTRRELTTK